MATSNCDDNRDIDNGDNDENDDDDRERKVGCVLSLSWCVNPPELGYNLEKEVWAGAMYTGGEPEERIQVGSFYDGLWLSGAYGTHGTADSGKMRA